MSEMCIDLQLLYIKKMLPLAAFYITETTTALHSEDSFEYAPSLPIGSVLPHFTKFFQVFPNRTFNELHVFHRQQL